MLALLIAALMTQAAEPVPDDAPARPRAGDLKPPPERPAPVERKLSPVWLPRYAAAHFFIAHGAFVPSLRIAWEVDLISMKRDALVFIAELGAGLALSTPTGVGRFYETTALFGLGYRMTRESGLHWGFNVGFGPALYGNQGDTSEQRVDPYIEGRVQLGYRFEALAVALCGGYGQWLVYDIKSVAQQYLGGPFIGVLVTWK